MGHGGEPAQWLDFNSLDYIITINRTDYENICKYGLVDSLHK